MGCGSPRRGDVRPYREISPDWTRLPDAAACERLVAWLRDLNAGFGIPSLGTFGAAEADIPELVHLTLEHFSASINPRQLRIEDAEAIYRVAL